jgi:cytochrome b pre-mRNA-processing protein 3
MREAGSDARLVAPFVIIEAARDAMLGFLFRGLTAEPARGAGLFDSVTAAARNPHWYIEGGVPDTLDGRFAVLATLLALTLVRLEQNGDRANRASVALTERFIEVMEAEHRELGLGDPSLGKKVRKLVGSLARRTELWRSATASQVGWDESTVQSLYNAVPSVDALVHSAAALKRWHKQLESAALEAIERGEF